MKNWDGKRVVIIGAARQGLALARYLATHGARVALNDHRPAEKMQTARESLAAIAVDWVLGSHPVEVLDGADLMCVSGGVPLDLPLLVEARRRGLPLTNDTQIFMDLVSCPTVGITGSAGKTTTTTLVGGMAQAGIPAPRKAWVGGNIGQPLIEYVDEIKPDDLVILELSSFQIELLNRSPQVAAILNITPNHLDRHGTMEAYTAAKARLLAFQDPSGIAVLGREDPGAWSLAGQVHGRMASFGVRRLPADQVGTFAENGSLWFWDGSRTVELMPESLIRLRGEHNRVNVLAACTIALAAGLPAECLPAGVDGFAGVPHRLQFIRSWSGADWYNDSIATAPERAMAAIRSFDEPLVLLAGGRDKKLPWQDLADLIHQRVDHLIVFGEAAEKIVSVVGPAVSGRRPFTLTVCEHLKQAVDAAAEVAEAGDVVLLSPGGTSYDEFNDFEERGERFIQWVKALS